MSDSITVVREAQSLDEAYEMGYRRFAGGDPVDDPARALDGFRGSASYANHVLPSLRCLAGYDDAGYGTWQVVRDIALIGDGDEGDHPADAAVIDSQTLYDELVDEWHKGAYAALEQAPKTQEVEA